MYMVGNNATAAEDDCEKNMVMAAREHAESTSTEQGVAEMPRLKE